MQVPANVTKNTSPFVVPTTRPTTTSVSSNVLELVFNMKASVRALANVPKFTTLSVGLMERPIKISALLIAKRSTLYQALVLVPH